MNKVYLLAPLIALAIFGGVYSKHARAYTARLDEKNRLELEAKREKTRQQVAAQETARVQAVAALAKRQAERAAQQQLDDAQKDARRDAEHRRATASAQEQRLRARLERLRTDITAVEEAVRRTETEIAELEREEAFLAHYVREATANRSSFYEIVERHEKIETSRITAVNPPGQPTSRR